MLKENLLKDIFIVDGIRTAIGSRFKSLKDFSAVELGAAVTKELLAKAKIKPDIVDEVIFGNTVSAGLGQNIARQVAICAGLPSTIPAFSVNNVCGSGLQSAILGVQSILCGQNQTVISGSTESASRNPSLSQKDSDDKKESLIYDGLWCNMCNKHMGELAEIIAQKFNISRQEQDKFAFESHQKAIKAQDGNKFTQEIIGVQKPNGEIFDKDEKPRRKTNIERLGNLPAAFVDGGVITAGNSCSPCDGAASIIVASANAVKQYGLSPKARILGYTTSFVEPVMTFTAATHAIPACLKKCNLDLNDIDLFEISEAFAVQAIFTRDKLGISNEKINVYGGDLALGHPLGAAGTRILVTLLYALIDQKKKKGIAAVCFGGGGSIAMAVEVL